MSSSQAVVYMVAQYNKALEELKANQRLFSAKSYEVLYSAIREQLNHVSSEVNHLDNSDEVRLVTVMFIDVIDSTEIANKLGNDDWRMVIGEAHQMLADEIIKWDGEVGQYLGDGLLSFFGASRSLSNDALRAVACALEIQKKTHAFSKAIIERYAKHEEISVFGLRIGISTGRGGVAVLGNNEKAETLVVGTLTNLAARLQSICPPGGVVVESETHKRTRTFFEFQSMPLIQLKGFEEPIEYYLVKAELKHHFTKLTSDAIGDISIPFVGRADTVERIVHELNRVKQYGGQRAIYVEGEIGIGKSRLLQEMSLHEKAQGYRIVSMIGQYERKSMAYGLIRSFIASELDLSDGLATEQIEQRIMEGIRNLWDDASAETAAAVLGYLGGYGFVDSPYTRSLHKNVSSHDVDASHVWIKRTLQGISNGQPLLILVDNLQWVDSESIKVLESFFYNNDECDLLLFMASRPTFRQEYPDFLTSATLHDRPILEYVELEPLNDGEAHLLIETVLQDVLSVPSELSNLISSRSEGNPLFIEEFLRMLFDNGVFEKNKNGHWKLNAFQYASMAGTLPNGLLGVFQARLDDLLGSARRVVQIASVVGTTFWAGAVSMIAEMDANQILDNLVARGIIVEQNESRFEGDREFRFRNTLYYEVAYSMLTRPYRVKYHGQTAEWLAVRAWSNPEILDLLADQYFHCGRLEEALATYSAAAEVQLERGLVAETLKLVESGLQAASTVPREVALPFVSKLWLLQGRASHSRRRYEEATAASQTAMMLMNELPPEDMKSERVLAGVTLGNAHASLGNYKESLEALQEAYDQLDESSSADLQASVLRAYGRLFWSRGNLDEAHLYQLRALLTAEESENEREVASVLSMLGRIAIDQGSFSVALSHYDRVLKINTESENYLYKVMDVGMISMIHMLLFDYEGALALLDEADKLQAQLKHDDPILLTNRALCLIGIGEKERGLSLLRESSTRDYLNIYDYHEVQLAFLRGLALTGHYAECQQRALSFTNTAQDHNPILYGRGLAKLGLDEVDATSILIHALDNEGVYGGRDLWMCHYALSIALSGTPEGTAHQYKAEDTLQKIAESLRDYPILKDTVAHLANPQQLFAGWLEKIA